MATTLAELLVRVDVDADRLESGAKSAAADVERSFDRAGRDVAQSFDKAEAAAKTSLDGIGAAARRTGEKVGGAGGEGGSGFVSGLASKLSGLGGQISGFATGAMSNMKGILAAGGAAAGVALVAGIGEAMGREAGTDRLAAQLGMSPSESKKAGKLAGDLYAEAYGDSMSQVNDAVGAVMSTLETDTKKATKSASVNALNMAATFDVDVVEAVGLAGIAVKDGLAGDADEAFDLIVRSMQKMPAAMRQELFPIVEEYGVFLQSLGFTGEEAFALIVRASEGGQFALDKTLDALKEFGIRATDMSTATVAAFDTIGLDAESMANQILAGGDTARGAFERIVTAILGIEDPATRANTAIALFGTPLEDLSTEKIPAFLEQMLAVPGSMGDVGAAAEELDTTLNDNVQVRFEEMKRQLESFAVETIDQYVLPALNGVSQWAKDNPVPFQVITAAVIGLAVAFAVLAVAMLPITLTMLIVAAVIGVVVAAIVLLIIYWDELKAAVSAVWDWIVMVVNMAKENIIRSFNSIVDFVKGLPGRIAGAASGMWDSITRQVTTAKDWIVARFGDVVNFVRGLPGQIAGAIAGLPGQLYDAGSRAISSLIDGLKSLNPVSIMRDIVGGITDLWPFSPAKTGPLRDHPPEDAGASIGRLFAGGLASAEQAVVREAERIARAAAMDPTMSGIQSPVVPGLASMAAGGGTTVNVTVQGSVRSDKELVAVIRDELNLGGFRGAIR